MYVCFHFYSTFPDGKRGEFPHSPASKLSHVPHSLSQTSIADSKWSHKFDGSPLTRLLNWHAVFPLCWIMIGSTLTLVRVREIPFWYLFPNFVSYHQSASHHFLSTFNNFRKCHGRDAILYWSLKGACLCVCQHVWASAKTLWNKMAAMNKEWVGFMNIACRLEWWTDRWTLSSWDRELICTLYPFNPSVCGGKCHLSVLLAGGDKRGSIHAYSPTAPSWLVCHKHHAGSSSSQQLPLKLVHI